MEDSGYKLASDGKIKTRQKKKKGLDIDGGVLRGVDQCTRLYDGDGERDVIIGCLYVFINWPSACGDIVMEVVASRCRCVD